MKIETRQVTIEKEFYIADDGTEFDTKDECFAYDCDILLRSLKMYDRKRNKCNKISHAVYVDLITETDVHVFISLSDYDGDVTEGISGPGLYMYDFDAQAWINLDEVMTYIRGGK